MTTPLRVVLVLLGLSLLGLSITNAPIYLHLVYLWTFLLLGSWAWSRLALHGLAVQRRTRTLRSQVGQIFEERFEVRNTSRLLCPWVEVRDASPLPSAQGSRVLTVLRGRSSHSYRARTRLSRRGVFPLGPTELISGDPFGLFPARRVFPPASALLVYPMTVPIRAFPSPPGLLPGGEALRRRTSQVTPNAAGIREYAPGDPLNRIHWPSTARRDRLIVKEFELDPLAEVWIVVDADRQVHVAREGTPMPGAMETLWTPRFRVALPPSTEEYAVTIAASLGEYFLKQGRAVGLIGWGATPMVLPPDRGGRQLNKMLEALAVFQADGEFPLPALLRARARHIPRGSTLVVITPAVQQEVAVAIAEQARRGLRPIAVLLNAATFGGPEGTTRLAAALTAARIPVYQIPFGANLEAVFGAL
ncbi:MAG: DUF58 domain-containing protein [Anaerolineae bacterium]|nr:DUF58 domain-containing protein [Anaerolineae bacterium]